MVRGGGQPGIWSELLVIGQDIPLLTSVTSLAHLEGKNLRQNRLKGTYFLTAIICETQMKASHLINNATDDKNKRERTKLYLHTIPLGTVLKGISEYFTVFTFVNRFN